MSRLLLYTDLSPSCLWLFATIHANRALLAEHGIDLGPIPFRTKKFASHRYLYRAVPDSGSMPPNLAACLHGVAERLDAGRDVLLMSNIPDRKTHRSLTRLLKQHHDLARHEVRAVFVVGHPVCFLEQCYRKMHPYPDKDAESLLSQCAVLPLVPQDARREWGEAHVTLLADRPGSPVALPSEALASALFAALGCSAPQPPEHLPRHPLFLASYAARRLCRALEVRDNAWPALDEGLFMDCLRATERDWGTEPASPLELRQRLIRESAADLRALEELPGLGSGALACPDWLACQAGASPDLLYRKPLDAEKIAAFAAALPPAVRIPLRRRYAHDAPLLTPDQRDLAAALDAVAADAPAPAEPSPAKDGMSIGEPVPPVELTVLTMTYNHERYIAECMDSVLAQRTTFPVRHIVLDHDSADDTPAIVAAYAERHPSIRPVLLSRHQNGENVMGLFLRCRTKYAALCDGDDYFTDPLKLQKQVDFLESRPHCALCFHPVAVVYESGEHPNFVFPPASQLPRGIQEEYYLADLLRSNMIQTNSVVYRWRFREGMPPWFRPKVCPGDWYWHLLHAETGKIGFLREIMSVYRRHGNAMYAKAFISTLDHRRTHGMTELAAYQTINEHFSNKYFLRLANLALGVFANFFEIHLNEGNSTLLDEACTNFPEFAQFFFKELKATRKGTPAPGE